MILNEGVVGCAEQTDKTRGGNTMGKTKSCVVCGGPISPAIAAHTDRCKSCDALPAKVRIDLMIRTRTAKYLGLIAQELKFIRNKMGGEQPNDDQEDSEE